MGYYYQLTPYSESGVLSPHGGTFGVKQFNSHVQDGNYPDYPAPTIDPSYSHQQGYINQQNMNNIQNGSLYHEGNPDIYAGTKPLFSWYICCIFICSVMYPGEGVILLGIVKDWCWDRDIFCMGCLMCICWFWDICIRRDPSLTCICWVSTGTTPPKHASCPDAAVYETTAGI
jgi:hypothetical protein